MGKDKPLTDEKTRFLRVYSNIPLGLRNEIILVLEDGRPITWDVAYFEVENKTDFDKEILSKLSMLEFI